MKKAIALVAPHIGAASRRLPILYDILHFIYLRLPISLRPAKIVYDQLAEFSKRKRDVFFIQIGANDGKENDPIHWFIKRFNWKGILVEPVPAYFEQLRNTYRDSQTLIFENVAISTTNQPKTFYYLRDEDNSLPPWAKGVGSFSIKHVLSLKDDIRDFNKYFVSMKVPCLTLRSLLGKHGIEHVDVIVIDAEGYDFEIIKQMDFDTIKPEIIVFESMLLGSQDRIECYRLLLDHGYELFDNECDTVAVLKIECGTSE